MEEEVKLYKVVEEELKLCQEVDVEVEEGGKLYPRVGYFSWAAI